MCEIYTTHPGKCPGKCPGKPITGGHGAFTLHSLRFIHNDDGHERTGRR